MQNPSSSESVTLPAAGNAVAARHRWGLNSLSGRLLVLTFAFVMLAEILIYLPSMARFRITYFEARIELADQAALALLAAPDGMVSPELEAQLLQDRKSTRLNSSH